jgi:hypothetical protein
MLCDEEVRNDPRWKEVAGDLYEAVRQAREIEEGAA